MEERALGEVEYSDSLLEGMAQGAFASDVQVVSFASLGNQQGEGFEQIAMAFFTAQTTDGDDVFCVAGPQRELDRFEGLSLNGFGIDGAWDDFESLSWDAVVLGRRQRGSLGDAQEGLASRIGFCKPPTLDPTPAVIGSFDVELWGRDDRRDPSAVGLAACWPADHGHMKESVVDDLDAGGVDMLREMLDLLVVDTSGPVEFWC